VDGSRGATDPGPGRWAVSEPATLWVHRRVPVADLPGRAVQETVPAGLLAWS